MDRYEITVGVEVDARRCRDLGCELLAPAVPGQGRLATPPIDQPALFGLLRRVRDAGLDLVAVRRIKATREGDSR